MVPLHPTLADPLGPGYTAGWYASSNVKGRKDDCKITRKGRNVVRKYYHRVRMALADNVTLESIFGRKVFKVFKNHLLKKENFFVFTLNLRLRCEHRCRIV